MIKGISMWSLPGGAREPLGSALALARGHGFGVLELCLGPGDTVHPGLTEAECAGMRRMIEADGPAVATLASGMSWGTNPVSDDPAVRERALGLAEAALQRAAWLGCRSFLYVPGVAGCPFVPERVRPDRALARAREGIGRLLGTCARVGVDLCVENVWNGMFYSAPELAAFIDSFGHERLGVYLDVGNLIGLHQHPPHWIELLGPRIRRVHVKDFRHEFGWDGRYSFCPLLEGDVPWAETMAALRGIGYDATLVAEMMPPRADTLPRTSQALDRILAM